MKYEVDGFEDGLGDSVWEKENRTGFLGIISGKWRIEGAKRGVRISEATQSRLRFYPRADRGKFRQIGQTIGGAK